MNNSSEIIGMLPALWKWRKWIIVVFIIAVLGSALISLLMPNYYKATSIFYAASEDLAKPDPIGRIERNANYYGQDRDIDRLLSIANAFELRQHLIQKFDLYAHYDIDPENKLAKFKIQKRFKKLYSTSKTMRDAIELSIEDKDPSMASQIVNEARDHISQISQNLIKESQEKLIESATQKIADKELNLRILHDSITRVKAHFGIYDLSTQGEILMTQKTTSQAKFREYKAKLKSVENTAAFKDSIAYFQTMVAAYSSQLSQVQKDLNLYNEGYGRVLSLEKELSEFNNQFSLDKERLKQLSSSYTSEFSAIHVIEEATIPVRKFRPRRSIIVIGVGLMALFVSILSVLMLESYKSVNWKELIDE